MTFLASGRVPTPGDVDGLVELETAILAWMKCCQQTESEDPCHETGPAGVDPLSGHGLHLPRVDGNVTVRILEVPAVQRVSDQLRLPHSHVASIHEMDAHCALPGLRNHIVAQSSL